MALQGNIETFYISSLLQLLSNDKKTGILRVSSGEDVIAIYMQEGTIIFATSSVKEERLGYLLRSEGIIVTDELERCLQIARMKNVKLGSVLIDEGYITPEDLLNIIHQQVENILYSLFMWKKGKFQYEDCELNLKDEAVTQLDTMEVVLEASRRVDEMSVLATQVPDKNQILKISETFHGDDEKKLEPNERAILSLIDGARSIKEVLNKSGYDEFTAHKVLFSLLSSGFVKITGLIQAAPDASGPLAPEHAASQSEDDFFLLKPSSDAHPVIDIPTIEPAQQPSEEKISSSLSLNNSAAAAAEPPAEKKEPALAVAPPPGQLKKASAPGQLPRPEKAAKIDAPLSPMPAAQEIGPEAKQLFGMPYKRAAFILKSGACALLAAVALIVLFSQPTTFQNIELSPEAKRLSEKANEFYADLKIKRSLSAEAESKAAAQAEPQPGASENSAPFFEEIPFQDSNAFFFVKLPAGYTLEDSSSSKKTSVVFRYSPNVAMSVNARPWTAQWDPEDEMYSKILAIQEGWDDFPGSKIETYGPAEFSGIKGYAISLTGYQDVLYCKTQLYAVCGYTKFVSIEIFCKGCKKKQAEELFNQIKSLIAKSFLLYP